MKKYTVSISLVVLMSLTAQGVFADDVQMVESPSEKIATSDMMYYPDSNFTLENIKKELNGRNGENVIEAEFDMISGNNLMDDYEYGSTHYYSKKLQTSVYIPEGLQRYIQKAQVKITREDYSPVMYDMSPAKDTVTTTGATQKNIVLDISLESLAEGTIEYDPALLRAMTTDENGASFMAQVELVMTNGKTIPFSHATYLYVQADNIEGKKAHLSNYYYTLNPNTGYPDLDGMLKTAFGKLKAASSSTQDYIASLKKVRAKVDAFTENYTKDIEKMLVDIDSDADFDMIVKDFGKVYARSNLLWDIGYRIDSEMTNDDAQKLIDELFSQE